MAINFEENGRTVENYAVAFPKPASADDPDYYLRNFFLILAFVQGRDLHLFTKEEAIVLAELVALPEASRRLYARLFNRKGPFFRVGKLNYPEIDDIEGAILTLESAGFTREPDIQVELELVLQLFTVPELKKALRKFGLLTKGIKCRCDVISALLSYAHKEGTLGSDGIYRFLTGHKAPICLLNLPVFERVFRLFFLNEWQGAGTLLAVDLAHLAYPSYEIRRSRPVFESRAILIDYECALTYLGQIEDLAGPENKDQLLQKLKEIEAEAVRASPPKAGEHPYLSRFRGASIRAQALYYGAKILEKQKEYRESAAIYKMLLNGPWLPHRRGQFWERLSIDLKHLGDKTGALEACTSALADKHLGEGQRGDLKRRLKVLKKSLGQPVEKPKKSETWKTLHIERFVYAQGAGQRTQFLDDDGIVRQVEEVALQYFSGLGWMGTWAENGFFTTLFARLCWDILFMPIPDVFQTPFQDRPLDLTTNAFYPARKLELDERFNQINQGIITPFLRDSLKFKGQAVRGLSWTHWSEVELEAAALALGGPSLSFIMSSLALDYRGLSRGFPDLLLWNAQGQARMVEVKGPTDRLSKEQRSWLRRLCAAGVDACVLKISSSINHEY